MPTWLNKRCDGSHDHTPCAGKNTLLTQGYTPDSVKLVHQSIVHDIAALNKASAQKQADGKLDKESAVSYTGRSILSVGIDEMEEQAALIALGTGAA